MSENVLQLARMNNEQKAARFRESCIGRERLTVLVSERCVKPRDPTEPLRSVTGRVKRVATNSAHVVMTGGREIGEVLIPMDDVVEIHNAKAYARG